MPLKKIANTKWKVKITPTPPGAQTPATQDKITWTLTEASKAKAGNSAILINRISWSNPGAPPLCAHAGFDQHSGSTANDIIATANKAKADHQAVLRKGDTGSCSCVFTNSSSSATQNCECSFEISEAGQENVQGQ